MLSGCVLGCVVMCVRSLSAAFFVLLLSPFARPPARPACGYVWVGLVLSQPVVPAPVLPAWHVQFGRRHRLLGVSRRLAVLRLAVDAVHGRHVRPGLVHRLLRLPAGLRLSVAHRHTHPVPARPVQCGRGGAQLHGVPARQLVPGSQSGGGVCVQTGHVLARRAAVLYRSATTLSASPPPLSPVPVPSSGWSDG